MSSSPLTAVPRLLSFSPPKPPLRHVPMRCTIQQPYSSHSRITSHLLIHRVFSCLAPRLCSHHSLALLLMTSISTQTFLPIRWPISCLMGSLLMLISSILLMSPLSCHTLDLVITSNFITSKNLSLKHPTPFHLLSSHLTLSSIPTSTNLQPLLGGSQDIFYAHHLPHVLLPLLLTLDSKVYN